MIAFQYMRLLTRLSQRSGAPPSCCGRLICIKTVCSQVVQGVDIVPSTKNEWQDGCKTSNSEVHSRHLPVSGIKHEQKEMTAYHKILETLPAYQSSIFTREDLKSCLQPFDPSLVDDLLKRDWSSQTDNSALFDAFRIVTSYAADKNLAISHDCFSPLTAALTDCFKSCSDEELLEVGKLMTLWPPAESTHAKNFKRIYSCLDQTLMKRYPKWFERRDINYVLRIMDVWFWLRLGKLNNFIRMSLNHILTKVSEPHHVVQLMFYLTCMHSLPMTYKAYDMEKKLYKVKDSCTIDELGCAVYGLFRSKSRLQYRPLILLLLKSLLLEADNVSPLILNGLCKALKLSVPREYRPALMALQTKLLKRVPDLPVESLVALVWLCSQNVVINDKFMYAVYQKILDNMENLRIKELTRFLTVCCEYRPSGVDLKKFSEKLLIELHKEGNVERMYRKDFMMGTTLHRLLLCGVFPADLIDNFLKSRTSVKDSVAALGLDVHIEAFYPEYDGARLSPKLCEEVYYYRFARKKGEVYEYPDGRKGLASLFNTTLLSSMRESLLLLVNGNGDCLYQTHTVPSSGFADVVMCFDEKENFHPIPDELKQIPVWQLKRIPPNLLNQGIFFVCVSFLQSLDEVKMTCLNVEKKKILKHLGYTPLEVHIHTWKNMTSSQKSDLVLQCIKSVTHK